MPRFRLFGYETLTDMDLATPMAPASVNAKAELLLLSRNDDNSPLPGIPLFLSTSLNVSGESSVQLFEVNDSTWLIRFPQIADFYLRQGEIECRLVNPEWGFMVDVLLLGHVMACYMERQGILALHAGAVIVDDQAVLLLGHKGAGKSTLVTSMVKAGFSLLADDISAVEEASAEVVCRPAFPIVKLSPEQIQRFVDGGASYPRFHPAFTKQSVPVSDLGRFEAETCPVGAIYLLERGEVTDISLSPVPPARAVAELAKGSFAGHMLEATPSKRNRFDHLVRVARAVPVKRLCYPDGFARLGDVHAAIRRDLALSR